MRRADARLSFCLSVACFTAYSQSYSPEGSSGQRFTMHPMDEVRYRLVTKRQISSTVQFNIIALNRRTDNEFRTRSYFAFAIFLSHPIRVRRSSHYCGPRFVKGLVRRPRAADHRSHHKYSNTEVYGDFARRSWLCIQLNEQPIDGCGRF